MTVLGLATVDVATYNKRVSLMNEGVEANKLIASSIDRTKHLIVKFDGMRLHRDITTAIAALLEFILARRTKRCISLRRLSGARLHNYLFVKPFPLVTISVSAALYP